MIRSVLICFCICHYHNLFVIMCLGCSCLFYQLTLWRPLLSYGYSYKASCARPAGCKLSFVIFDIRAPWRSRLSVRVPGCQKLQMTAYTRRVWHRMLYSCTHMTTVGVKGLTNCVISHGRACVCWMFEDERCSVGAATEAERQQLPHWREWTSAEGCTEVQWARHSLWEERIAQQRFNIFTSPPVGFWSCRHLGYILAGDGEYMLTVDTLS